MTAYSPKGKRKPPGFRDADDPIHRGDGAGAGIVTRDEITVGLPVRILVQSRYSIWVCCRGIRFGGGSPRVHAPELGGHLVTLPRTSSAFRRSRPVRQ